MRSDKAGDLASVWRSSKKWKMAWPPARDFHLKHLFKKLERLPKISLRVWWSSKSIYWQWDSPKSSLEHLKLEECQHSTSKSRLMGWDLIVWRKSKEERIPGCLGRGSCAIACTSGFSKHSSEWQSPLEIPLNNLEVSGLFSGKERIWDISELGWPYSKLSKIRTFESKGSWSISCPSPANIFGHPG